MNGLVIGPEVVLWASMKMADHPDFGQGAGIGWARNWQIVAGVVYTDFNGANVCMHVVAEEGRRWLSRQFLAACFDYPFNQLKVKRVTGTVAEGNAEARRFDEHLGFELEARLKDAHPTGDLLVYRMFKEQCKWLRPEFTRRLSSTLLRVA